MGKRTQDSPQVDRGREAQEAQKGAIMPKVGGKKYPYTKAGKAAAKKAAKSKMGKKRGR